MLAVRILIVKELQKQLLLNRQIEYGSFDVETG